MLGIKAEIDVLSQQEKEMIHEKSLIILKKIGLHTPFLPFLKLMEEHGAVVDYQKQIMRLCPETIETVLESRRHFKPGTKHTLTPIKGDVSTEIYLVDYKNKTRRLGVLDDVMKGIALLNQLSAFPTANAVVVPSDVQPGAADIVAFQKIFTYSQKPGGTYILSPLSAEYIIQMAKVMERTVSYGFQTISPLRFSSETLKMAMIFYEKGYPAVCGPFVMSMGSGPVTTAGSLLLQNAEYLACMFITNVLSGQLPSYNETIHPLDPGSLVCSFGAPGITVSALGGCSMANFYGLNSGGNVGLTDSLEPDFQCGFEKAISAAFAALSGGIAVGGQGIVGADQGISLEQLVIDNDWIGAFNSSIKGILVNEDTLAETLIHEVGIGGNFTAEEHTVEHLRECYWKPSVFSREQWGENNKNLLERAEERVLEYTRDYQKMQPVILSNIAEELDRIATQGIADAKRANG